MGRRLAEATKACRTRLTRGETVLCFFLVPVEAPAVFGFGFDAVLFEAAGFDVVGFDVVLLDVVGCVAVLAGGLLSTGVEDCDWAAAGNKKPSATGKDIPARTKTAKQRTQTLPTAESWHP
jgi:hypothetical protein